MPKLAKQGSSDKKSLKSILTRLWGTRHSCTLLWAQQIGCIFLRRNLLLCNKTSKIVQSFDPEILLLCLYPKEILLDTINKNLYVLTEIQLKIEK